MITVERINSKLKISREKVIALHVLILGGIDDCTVERINSKLKLLREKVITLCVDPGGDQ